MALTTTIKRYWRSIPGGAGVNSVSLSLKKHSDNTEVTSASTAGTGAAAGLATLSPTYLGPTYLSGTNAGTTLTSSSKDVDFLGTIAGYDVDVIGLALTSGVVKGQLSDAAVTAAGTDMEVDIAAGAFLVQGHPYRNTASAAVVIGANASGNPRIDRVVIRHYPKGTANEGHAELAVLAGTAAASPSAPAVTQSAVVWEVSLAQVAVANGATSIATANLTDERPFVGPTAAGAVIQALLDLKANLANPTFSGTVTTPNLTVTTGVSIPAGAIDAADIGGGNVSDTEYDFLNGVTSAIQTQLDGKQATDSDLVALAGVAAAGLLARTGSGTAQARTVTAGTGISVTNGDGVSGNPTVALTDTASKLSLTGGTLTGLLKIAGSLTSILTLETAAGEDVVRVSTDLGAGGSKVYLLNGTDIVLFSDDGSTTKAVIDGAAGNIYSAGDLELDGALNHDGSTVGFYGSTPVAKGAALTAVSTATVSGTTWGTGEKAVLDSVRSALNDLESRLQDLGLIN